MYSTQSETRKKKKHNNYKRTFHVRTLRCAKLLRPLPRTTAIVAIAVRRFRAWSRWGGRDWTTLVGRGVPFVPLRAIGRRGVGMIRNAATLRGTPVPRWRAARTGGGAGGAGWSTMGKAACRGVIPKYVTAFNGFDEWNQKKKGALTRTHHWSNHPGRGLKERKSSNSRLCSMYGHSCKSGCSAKEGRSGGSRTCLSKKKKGKSWRSRVSSSWENVPSDQYQFSV